MMTTRAKRRASLHHELLIWDPCYTRLRGRQSHRVPCADDRARRSGRKTYDTSIGHDASPLGDLAPLGMAQPTPQAGHAPPYVVRMSAERARVLAIGASIPLFA